MRRLSLSIVGFWCIKGAQSDETHQFDVRIDHGVSAWLDCTQYHLFDVGRAQSIRELRAQARDDMRWRRAQTMLEGEIGAEDAAQLRAGLHRIATREFVYA